MKDWFYNEFNHVGVDYSEQKNVEIYDEQMESFRDYDKEAKAFVEKLGASKANEFIVIDIGWNGCLFNSCC